MFCQVEIKIQLDGTDGVTQRIITINGIVHSHSHITGNSFDSIVGRTFPLFLNAPDWPYDDTDYQLDGVVSDLCITTDIASPTTASPTAKPTESPSPSPTHSPSPAPTEDPYLRVGCVTNKGEFGDTEVQCVDESYIMTDCGMESNMDSLTAIQLNDAVIFNGGHWIQRDPPNDYKANRGDFNIKGTCYINYTVNGMCTLLE